MPHLQLPEIRLYYEERGEGVPILCIHGTSSSAMAWQDSLDELARLGRVIAYDRRGCTRSQRPDPYHTTSISEHADDAAALLGALSATPAIVIGRSYGGAVAIDLALRHPEHVRALVLLEAADLNLTPGVQAWMEELSGRITSAGERDIDLVAETLLRNVLGDEMWEQFPEQMQQMFTDNSPAILAEIRGGPLGVDTSDLATIDKPTLLVASKDSPEAFRRETATIAAAIPGSRTVLIGGGHMINPADPAVLEFIQEVVAESKANAALSH